MKERPVIFNGEMVRAILDGRKTQTRRVMKVQPKQHDHKNYDAPWACKSPNYYNTHEADWACRYCGEGIGMDGRSVYRCPFGQVGDRMWVRETFGDCGNRLVYRADTEDGAASQVKCWVPSIHMPREACRILLEITAVRVERLNDISEEDAEAEGIDMEALYDSQDCYDCIADHNMTGRPTVKGAFKYLWESIYGVDSWSANPWVWVIKFKQVSAREVERG
ncbi:hypothetical protein LZ334_02210 [Serratia ureilytica]|uniref:hypothetical protein n=1 Tax=Serratia ureilytica TaxID=300181 RepID=UPI002578A81C|nr:hypothetical protein [Serratia ureilytica]MDM1814907.1 hypothetical protein [Serratia ureilytica]